MNRLIKKHYTSAKAVKLFEDDDNDTNELFSSDEDSLACVPDTPQKVTKHLH